jgi:hypothetical protein
MQAQYDCLGWSSIFFPTERWKIQGLFFETIFTYQQILLTKPSYTLIESNKNTYILTPKTQLPFD